VTAEGLTSIRKNGSNKEECGKCNQTQTPRRLCHRRVVLVFFCFFFFPVRNSLSKQPLVFGSTQQAGTQLVKASFSQQCWLRKLPLSPIPIPAIPFPSVPTSYYTIVLLRSHHSELRIPTLAGRTQLSKTRNPRWAAVHDSSWEPRSKYKTR
jgi:hypothetical protein